MKINGLNIIETDEGLVYALTEPFWGAWKLMGWANRDAGIGLNKEVIQYAFKVQKPIIAVWNKDRYKITAEMVEKFYSSCEKKPIYAVGSIKLIVIPISLFEREKGRFDEREYRKKEAKRARANQIKMF